jgi:amino acid transporter
LYAVEKLFFFINSTTYQNLFSNIAMFSTHTKMPRNVGPLQSAAILYGDWGTSKAYVIGLAYALTGHASFWLIALVSFLNILVGINYIVICKYYPNGGGVYASVRHRSKVLALLGAFFLIADYMVTASLSALSAFYYFGFSSPDQWAMAAILLIGCINFLGPRYSANLALVIALPTFGVMVFLGLLALPHLEEAVIHLQPLKGNFSKHWLEFVSIIVALSGIESIANITGVMKLDKGSSRKNPSVANTSRKAILWVTCEVAILTALFGLAVNAIPGLEFSNHTVNAPGEPDVRDYMLRYMGLVFGTNLFGASVGKTVSIVVSTVISRQYGPGGSGITAVCRSHRQGTARFLQKAEHFRRPFLCSCSCCRHADDDPFLPWGYRRLGRLICGWFYRGHRYQSWRHFP